MLVGIDLGTTNSLIGLWREGRVELVRNVHGETLTPSVVGLDDDGSVLVGRSARERLITRPQSTTAAFKRYMGTQREVKLGSRAFRPEELSALVLRSLKADAEALTGQTVDQAVITVPAYFNELQRKATKHAGELAGLRVDRLLNEPTAAALAYGLHEAPPESKFLVFDLGGGTFDVSILEMFEGVIEVRASTGDNFLGGEDFVDALIGRFVEAATGDGLPAPRPPALEQALRFEAERVKRALSTQPQVDFMLDWDGRSWRWTCTGEEFERLCEPLIQRLRQPIERALRDARIRSAEIENIVLAGGATRMPMVRRLVARLFGRLPASNLNPDEVVAMGAAVMAGLEERDHHLDEIVMTDVCPYSLGIETAQRLRDGSVLAGQFAPIIERNTVIPASRVKQFNTIGDWQKSIKVDVYQGESRKVGDNILLGSVEVPVPRKRAGEVAIDVRFTYDVNGLLEIEVTVPSTGEKRELVLQESPGAMSADEIATRLAALGALKIHPREQETNRTLLARADRLYESLRGDERELVGNAVTEFEHSLDRQDPHEIEAIRVRFAELLDRLESDRYL